MTSDLLAALPARTPESIAAARHRAGLSQRQAAQLVGSATYQRWHEWETGVHDIGAVRWAVFLLATGQHPSHQVACRDVP
jgi:hypothetical protein